MKYGVKSKYERRKQFFMSHCCNSTLFTGGNCSSCSTSSNTANASLANGFYSINNGNVYYGGSYLTSVFYRITPVNSTSSANGGGCACGCNSCYNSCGCARQSNRCGWNTCRCNRCTGCNGWATLENGNDSVFGCCNSTAQTRRTNGCCLQ